MIDARPAVRQMRAMASLSSSVMRLPITRKAIVIRNCERMPTGPKVVRNPGTVSNPAKPPTPRVTAAPATSGCRARTSPTPGSPPKRLAHPLGMNSRRGIAREMAPVRRTRLATRCPRHGPQTGPTRIGSTQRGEECTRPDRRRRSPSNEGAKPRISGNAFRHFVPVLWV